MAAQVVGLNDSVELIDFENAQKMPMPLMEFVKPETHEDIVESIPAPASELNEGNLRIPE